MLPLRLLFWLVINLLLAPLNLVRVLRRSPRWIKVRIDGRLGERPPERRWLWRRPRGVTMASLEQLGRALRRAPRVTGVLLEIERIEAGWARLDALRGLIASWRALGKQVVAHLSSPGNREIYVACACDRIVLDPSGPLMLIGLAAEAGFYGEALRRLGVDAEFERMAEYKTAPDTFTRADMSPEQRQTVEAILDDVEQRFLAALAEGRRRSVSEARAWVDGGPYEPEAARTQGLVDDVLYVDEIAEHLGVLPEAIVGHGAYLRRRPRWWRTAPWRQRRRLAVLSLEGTIVPGEGSEFPLRTLGAQAAVRTLERLARDAGVGAVVLYVNSRGGSSSASERIWRGIERLATKKPVVACFGEVAASGGYYLALAARWIVAAPSTLTGSIGVFAGKLSIGRLLDRLGVGTAVLRRGRVAAMMSTRRPFDDVERGRLRAQVEATYRQFLARVAAGRKLSDPGLDELARGRVWTGSQAKERGLIDELGGLAEAIATAKRQAGAEAGQIWTVSDVKLIRRRGRTLVPGLETRPWAELLAALEHESAWLIADGIPRID